MLISVSELKLNIGKYLDLAEIQDIYITKYGQPVAKIISTKVDKVAEMKSVFGAIPPDADLDEAKCGRLLCE